MRCQQITLQEFDKNEKISTQVFDELTAHILVKKYLAPQDSSSIRRPIRVAPEFTLTAAS
jgi:hypothetical protein